MMIEAFSLRRFRAAVGVALLGAMMPFAAAQTAGASGTGSTLAFEVASVHQNKSDEPAYSNFPLNSGAQYTAKGGLLQARNMPVLQFLVFAYKPDMYQIQLFRSKLPEWARTARFDIEAHAEDSRGKDDMRLMMQTLLAERFHLVLRREVREVPAYGLVLVKAGGVGRGLTQHPASDPDCTAHPLPQQLAGAYPVQCGSAASVAPATAGDQAAAGYNLTLEDVARAVGGVGNVRDRPVIDQTGLSGRFDLKLEFTPETNLAASAGDALQGSGTTFTQALKEQLGLKLVPTVSRTEVLVIERIELPSAN